MKGKWRPERGRRVRNVLVLIMVVEEANVERRTASKRKTSRPMTSHVK